MTLVRAMQSHFFLSRTQPLLKIYCIYTYFRFSVASPWYLITIVSQGSSKFSISFLFGQTIKIKSGQIDKISSVPPNRRNIAKLQEKGKLSQINQSTQRRSGNGNYLEKALLPTRQVMAIFICCLAYNPWYGVRTRIVSEGIKLREETGSNCDIRTGNLLQQYTQVISSSSIQTMRRCEPRRINIYSRKNSGNKLVVLKELGEETLSGTCMHHCFRAS